MQSTLYLVQGNFGNRYTVYMYFTKRNDVYLSRTQNLCLKAKIKYRFISVHLKLTMTYMYLHNETVVLYIIYFQKSAYVHLVRNCNTKDIDTVFDSWLWWLFSGLPFHYMVRSDIV